jgi:hypothetical protein
MEGKMTYPSEPDPWIEGLGARAGTDPRPDAPSRSCNIKPKYTGHSQGTVIALWLNLARLLARCTYNALSSGCCRPKKWAHLGIILPLLGGLFCSIPGPFILWGNWAE